MLPQRELLRTMFPIGHMTKAEVRARASALGLRTAAKPDSQDVCFITHAGGREQFLGDRIPFRRAEVVDDDGRAVGAADAVELVTIGQRRGIGLVGGGPKRYVVAVDPSVPKVVVGDESLLLRDAQLVGDVVWAHEPLADGERVLVQCSAHGAAHPARVTTGRDATVEVAWHQRQRVVAPGQSVVFYDPSDERVLGGGIAR